MRLLTLIRHAKSSWDYPELTDFERPLNERGRRDAPRMASYVRKLIGIPDRIVSSPALRAIATARIFADTLAIDANRILIEPRIYEASLDTLLTQIQLFDDADRHVMLFGHNPGLTDLAHTLARCSFDHMPTCAVAQIGFDAKVWSDVCERSGQLHHYAYPKLLKD